MITRIALISCPSYNPRTMAKSTRRGEAGFRTELLNWYDANRRDLPWRRTGDPYRIWVSEIMLQQTRVAAVLDHYERFFRRFPTVINLASAREQTVLAAWSGLGYYRRARNLHACAKKVAQAGGFPKSSEELRLLPGIGRYTAAAIASIAFGEKCAAVDGNVERVLSRMAGRKLESAETWQRAGELMAADRPGDFNQAMMELGALVCLPGGPKCTHCPVRGFCAAKGDLGLSRKEQREVKQLSLALARRDGKVWLVQRDQNASLMPGMWELPQLNANGDRALGTFRHAILNADYRVTVYESGEAIGQGKWVSETALDRVALTGLSRKVMLHVRAKGNL